MYQLIDKLRRRPGMYIGYHSPTHLHSFLSGYLYSKDFLDETKEEPNFNGFHDWVANKFSYKESTSGWAYMIEDQREDKEEALWLFFELLDEYRGIQHTQVARTPFKKENKLDRRWLGYSRLKKVRGTFAEVPKPLPQQLAIYQIELEESWYSLMAFGDNNAILFVWNSDELDRVYQRAYEIFGVEKSAWSCLEPLKKGQ